MSVFVDCHAAIDNLLLSQWYDGDASSDREWEIWAYRCLSNYEVIAIENSSRCKGKTPSLSMIGVLGGLLTITGSL